MERGGDEGEVGLDTVARARDLAGEFGGGGRRAALHALDPQRFTGEAYSAAARRRDANYDPGMMPASIVSVFEAGGVVMWPLLALSVVSLAFILERSVFWARLESGKGRTLASKIRKKARRADWSGARALAESDRSVFGSVALELMEMAGESAELPSEADAFEAVERARPALERYSAFLSAAITAAPMLGILGTVSGIIESFRLLGSEGPIADPAAVASGIAEALITTAFGLIIALGVLFPYVVFRARAERTLTDVESFAQGLAASLRAHGPGAPGNRRRGEASVALPAS